MRADVWGRGDGQSAAREVEDAYTGACSHKHTHRPGNSAANEQMVREIEDNLAWRDYRNKIKELEEEMQDRLDELHSLPTKKVTKRVL
jgi:hypothetical protein